jgi:glycosyltransferase involved in cell wall biosynthesis
MAAECEGVLAVKIGIYNEPSRGGIGGCEYSIAILAEALSGSHQVEIVHHKTVLDTKKLEEFSETDLSDVRLRYITPDPFSFGQTRIPWKRYREARAWHAHLSNPYDLFVAFVHGYPPFSHARRAILMVLFPFDEPPIRNAECHMPSRPASGWMVAKRLYHEWEWKQRLDCYPTKATISDFSKLWAQRRWGIDCQVIYPPVDTSFMNTDKENRIMSTGRFTTSGHSKRQRAMLSAFKQIKKQGLWDWSYIQTGSLGDSVEDHEYFHDVLQKATSCDTQVMTDVPRRVLKQLYARAKIFWHAAGFDQGEAPELSEHFGMATVEAMAAGCVPVVVNRGAQPEIVEHQVSGFLWNTLEELINYTLLLTKNDELREKMSAAARARAHLFAKDKFLSGFSSLL